MTGDCMSTAAANPVQEVQTYMQMHGLLGMHLMDGMNSLVKAELERVRRKLGGEWKTERDREEEDQEAAENPASESSHPTWSQQPST